MAPTEDVVTIAKEMEEVTVDDEDYVSDHEDDPQVNLADTRPSPWRTGKLNVSGIVNDENIIRSNIKCRNFAAKNREEKILDGDIALKEKVFSILRELSPGYDLKNLYIHDIWGNYVMVRVKPKFSIKVSGGIQYIHKTESVNKFNGAIVDVTDPTFVLYDYILNHVRGYADQVVYKDNKVTVINGSSGFEYNAEGSTFTRHDDSPFVRVWKRDGEIRFSTSYCINGKQEQTNPQWQMFPTSLWKEYEPYEIGISSLFANVTDGFVLLSLRTKNLCSAHYEVEYGPVLLTSSLPAESLVNFGLFQTPTTVSPEKFVEVFSQKTIFLDNAQFGESEYGAFSINACPIAGTVVRSFADMYQKRLLPTSTAFTARMFELSNVRFLSNEEYLQRWVNLIGEIKTADDRIKNTIEILYRICPAHCLEEVRNFYEENFGANGVVKELPRFLYERYLRATSGNLKLENYEKNICKRARDYSRGDMFENIRLTIECNDPAKPHVDGTEIHKIARRYKAIQRLIAKATAE